MSPVDVALSRCLSINAIVGSCRHRRPEGLEGVRRVLSCSTTSHPLYSAHAFYLFYHVFVITATVRRYSIYPSKTYRAKGMACRVAREGGQESGPRESCSDLLPRICVPKGQHPCPCSSMHAGVDATLSAALPDLWVGTGWFTRQTGFHVCSLVTRTLVRTTSYESLHLNRCYERRSSISLIILSFALPALPALPFLPPVMLGRRALQPGEVGSLRKLPSEITALNSPGIRLGQASGCIPSADHSLSRGANPNHITPRTPVYIRPLGPSFPSSFFTKKLQFDQYRTHKL